MTILVTGGAGFIGSHVVDGYVGLGYRVIVVDNLATGKKEFINKKAVFYKADIRDREKIAQIISKEKPELISHHAAQISVRQSVADPVGDAEINIIGLLNLLEEGRINNLKKVIFASSGGVVYGDASMLPTPEVYEPKLPLSPYGIAKLGSEYYLNYYFQNYKIPYLALRYSNVYGPRQNPLGEAGVVAIFSNKLLKGKVPTVNGDGSQTRDYVFIADVVAANINSLGSKFIGGVNIGTGIETDVNKIYWGIEKHVRSGIKPKHGPAKQGEQKRSCIAISLAKKVLHWRPKFELTLGLKDTVDFFRSG